MRLPRNPNHPTTNHQSGATFCFPVHREQSVPASKNQRLTGATPQRSTFEYTPTLQPLEPRLLLTAYVVDSLLDVVADDGFITLREAIEAANTNTAVTADVQPGSATETDTITFNPALTASGPATITLNGTELQITDSLDITGPGRDLLTIDADNQSSVLRIGPAIYGESIDVELSGMTITGGGNTNYGTGVYHWGGNLTIEDAAITGNHAVQDGGGILSYNGNATLINVSVTDNQADRIGGGIYKLNGTLTVTGCTIQNNHSDFKGGGIYNHEATVSIADSTIVDNVCLDSVAPARGGGIDNYNGTISLFNSTLSENQAYSGGGISNYSGSITIGNSLLSGNHAEQDGGAIDNIHSGALIIVTNSTLSGNSASTGGGINSGNLGEVVLNNSIVSMNESSWGSSDIYGNYLNNNSLVSINPLFLRNPSDGGDGWIDDPTTLDIDESANNDYGDLRLQPTSPAVNAGDNTLLPADEYDLDNDGDTTEPLPVDLDGYQRITDSTVDIGAYEFVPARHYVVNSLLDTVADDGFITLREAIEAANTNTAPTADVLPGSATETDTITFDPALTASGPATITLNGTELQITDSLDILGPGQNLLTIDANQQSRVFNISGSKTEAQLSRLTITGGDNENYGGGILNYYSSLTLLDTVVTNNTASILGGGIYNYSYRQDVGNVALINSTLSRNSATGGGGMYIVGLASIVNSKIIGNYAMVDGGGISLRYISIPNGEEQWSSTLTMTNSMVVGNVAGRDGGGIQNFEGVLELTNVTIAENIAEFVGGIYNGSSSSPSHSGPITINNSIIANNHELTTIYKYSKHDIFFGTNIINDQSNLISTDPLFLRNPSDGGDGWIDDPDTPDIDEAANNDYGDLQLQLYSPAVNNGDNTLLPADEHDLDDDGDTTEPLPVDLAGNLRINLGTVDIGAYENQSTQQPQLESPSTVVTTTIDRINAYDGIISLREAIMYAQTLQQQVTFDASLTGQTITLNGEELLIDHSVIINASAIGGLTIDADGQSRVMNIQGATTEVALVSLTITGGYIEGEPDPLNYPEHIGGDGGGIYCTDATLTLVNSKVQNNNADYLGGGIYILNGSLKVINSIIHANNAGSYRGGGIYIEDSHLTIDYSTIAGNYGDNYYRDADYHYSYSANNSILENAFFYGTWHTNCLNDKIVENYNPLFVHKPGSGPDGIINTADDDPDDQGDLHILPTSDAINSGYNYMLPADQYDLDNDGDTTEPLPIDIDGNPRVSAGTIDIGAYEYQVIPGDTNLDNTVDLIDLVTLGENYNQPGQWAQGDFNGDHFVDLVDLVTLGENYNTSASLTLASQPATPSPSPSPAIFLDNPITPVSQSVAFHCLNQLTEDDQPTTIQLF